MDTVSMLNTMRFYCQPILPLVYDESMSYYETLCKVVGQLNTTGETVNKLNEGLTNEISDRQAADAALDERLKVIEAANEKIHFLVFDGANPNGGFPTRHELYQWVEAGDAIFALFRTNEEGRGQIYAASCSYNAGNWGSESSNDFNIIVPLETKYDGAYDYAVKQKVAKLTIPPIPQTSLNVPWGLQIIEINTPYTSAEGVVNVIAVVSDSGSVNCSITPSEFLQLYNMTRGGKNLCVAVNAKLAYDGLARSSSIATVDTTNRIVRIAFERDFGTAITNGVNQLNKTLDYIIGDAKTGTWVHEAIDYKIFDFIRYEGFQFTRGADNVITTDDESTPNAVYMQYRSKSSGKLYQNLPVRLIDTVDGAEYWNGTFDIHDDKHMTFTFVTSNYDTASHKMLVRVIELSADVNTTAWKYGVKVFSLPLAGVGEIAYVDFWPTGSEEVYDKDIKGYVLELATDQTFDAIFDFIKSGNKTVARLYNDATKSSFPLSSVDATVSGNKTLGTIHFQFVSAGTGSVAGFTFIGETITLLKAGSKTTIFITAGKNVLPTPNADGTDNGKVPTINGNKWELKTPDDDSGFKCFIYDASTAAAEMTPAEVKAFIKANPQTPIYMLIYGVSTGTRPIWAVQQTWANDTVVFASTTITRTTGVQEYKLVKAASDTAWGVISTGRLVTDDTPSVANPTFAEDFDGHAEIVLGVGEASSASNENLPYLAPGDYLKDTIDGMPWSDLRLYNGVFAYRDVNIDSIYNKVRDGTMLPDIDFVLTNAVLIGTVAGEITNYTAGYYDIIKDEISRNRCNIWLSFNGETIRLASWKQAGSDTYALTFFGAGASNQPVKYVVTASASAATLAVSGS